MGPLRTRQARRLVQQFTLYERIQQLVLATLRQPLSYVLLLGAVGFFCRNQASARLKEIGSSNVGRHSAA